MLTEGGYSVRLRVRVMKTRKRVNGRARGFYESNTYVYARVKGPDGRVRDIYLGTTKESANRGVKKSPPATSSSSAAGENFEGRKRGEKAAPADTRDPYDDRTMAMWPARKRR